MVEENLHNETEIRRFLLGEMSADERSALEEKFVADENLFEQISVAEDELIESYIRNTLSSDEKIKFERNFLSTDARRRRVAFTRTMFDKINKKNEIVVAKKTETVNGNLSVLDSIASFFKTPKFVFGAAFAALLLAFGVWFLILKSPNNEIELAGRITPTPTIHQPTQNQNSAANQNFSANSDQNAAEKNLVNKNTAPNANGDLLNKNQNADVQKPDSVKVAPILALFAGMNRAEGKTPELNLPKNASGANLQLNLESQDYKIYRVEMVDPDGRLIVQNNKLKSKNSKINFFVSAEKLQRGDYLIKLSALNPNNENESVADYSFRVNRK